MEILKSIDEESKKREQILNADTSIRGDLYRSVIFPNTEKFIPITARDGTTRLMPGNQNFYLFRGQTRDYPSCPAKIYRNSQDQIDIFVARLRQIEFEIVLTEHAAVQDIIKSGIHISFAGLAQHYELATEYLDVTSDPYVAAFFAVCRYSQTKRRYVPVPNQDKKGVLMKTFALVFSANPMSESKLEILGLQPFPRPGNQKAYAMKLEKDESFSAHKMFFHHNLKSSQRIYELFDGGAKLFPSDPIQKKAQEITEGKIFTRNAFDEVITRYGFPSSSDYYLQQLKQKSIEISNNCNSIFKFSEAELNQFSEDWESDGKTAFSDQIGPSRLTY
jgi:hypothetical protein